MDRSEYGCKISNIGIQNVSILEVNPHEKSLELRMESR